MFYENNTRKFSPFFVCIIRYDMWKAPPPPLGPPSLPLRRIKRNFRWSRKKPFFRRESRGRDEEKTFCDISRGEGAAKGGRRKKVLLMFLSPPHTREYFHFLCPPDPSSSKKEYVCVRFFLVSRWFLTGRWICEWESLARESGKKTQQCIRRWY